MSSGSSDDSGQGFLGTLIRGSSRALILRVLGVGLGVGVQVLLARTLGAFHFGVYSVVLSFVAMASLPATLGLDAAAVRFLPGYLQQEDWELVRGYVRFSLLAVLAATLAIAGGSLGWIQTMVVSITRERLEGWLLGCLVLPFAAWLELSAGITAATKAVGRARAPIELIRPLLLLLLVLGAWGGGLLERFTPSLVGLGAYLLACALALVVAGRFLKSTLPTSVFMGTGRYRPAEWVGTSVPLSFVASSFAVLAHSDILILGYSTGAGNAAVYAASVKIAGLLGYVQVAVNLIAAPMISEEIAKGDPEKVKEVYHTASRLLRKVSLAGGLVLCLFHRYALAVFGPEFVPGAPILLMLLVSQLIAASFGVVGVLTTVSGHHMLAAGSAGVAAVVNLGLNVWLIPRYGAVAAAGTTLLSTIIWYSILGARAPAMLRNLPEPGREAKSEA